MAAINTYGGAGGYGSDRWYTDACPVCTKTHVLYSLAQADGWYRCYAAGMPGTPVQTAVAADTPVTSAVRALIAAGAVVGS